MEMLIVSAAEHERSDSFMSASSKTFRQINCRTFQSGVGLLPKPKVQSPKSVFNHPSVDSYRRTRTRTSPIPIFNSKSSQNQWLSSSELWAGPTYSNSPPPASVPIPKFSLKEKRTISLTFPACDSSVEGAKSAPVSPTFHSTVSATLTLRRMLNLETADE